MKYAKVGELVMVGNSNLAQYEVIRIVTLEHAHERMIECQRIPPWVEGPRWFLEEQLNSWNRP